MLNLREVATVDFETLPIVGRPRHPPPPVGVSIKVGAGKSKYLSWGHIVGKNNSTWSEARRALGELWSSGRPLLFHHAKFDQDVAEAHMGMPQVPWDRVHDTMPALFLKDPYAKSYQLKPSAEKILGWKAEERDAVVDWLLEHQPLLNSGIRLSKSKDSEFYAGGFVAFAPAELTGEYAVGDTDRTWKLAEKVFPEVDHRGMADAYDRERRLVPVLLEMERNGVRVDASKLEKDERIYTKAILSIDAWLCRRLRAARSTNWDSPDQLGAAMVEAGVAKLNKTATGKWEVNKDALLAGVQDRQLLAVLKYRSQVTTCLKTFIRPWLETATLSGGFIYTDWTSTRRDKGSGMGGAKTGRLQTSPNFQNMAKEFEPLFKHEVDWAVERGMVKKEDADELRARLPRCPIDLLHRPNVRSYVVPEKGHVLLDRDYSQQEPRILAHFEAGVEGGGRLLAAYLADPWIDFHENAQRQLEAALKRPMKRKVVKGFNLGIMYGMGIGLMAARAGVSVNEAKVIRNGILGVYPGLKAMYREMRERAARNEPIRTWGGSEIYCEPPALVEGRIREFDYKLVNALIQRSAAECTKEAMIRFHHAKPKDTKLLLSIHDEAVAEVPRGVAEERMELLRECMESIEFDVPMLSEGAWSAKSFGDLEEYDKKGTRTAKRLAA